jgi:hypothetical protein
LGRYIVKQIVEMHGGTRNSTGIFMLKQMNRIKTMSLQFRTSRPKKACAMDPEVAKSLEQAKERIEKSRLRIAETQARTRLMLQQHEQMQSYLKEAGRKAPLEQVRHQSKQ